MTNAALRGILLCGAALGLTACGGAGTSGPATIPAPPIAVEPPPPPTPPVDDTLVLTDGLTVRQEGVDYYRSNDFIVYPSNWGAEALGIPKSEYTQKVEIRKSTFPEDTLFTWNYPDAPYGNGATVYGFAGIGWGKTTLALTGYNTDNAITSIGQIDKFVVNYDVTLNGDKKYINLMHDLFMYDNKSGKLAAEITFNVAPSDHILYWGSPDNYYGQQPGAHSYSITTNGANYNMLVSSFSPNSGMQTIENGRMIIIIPTDGSQITKGTIDWAEVLKILLDNKDLDPDWLIKGTELGIEIQAGDGSMRVNGFNVELTLKDQKVQAMVAMVADAAATTTSAASQINAATMQQILDAALANQSATTTTYTFGQTNIGTNFAVSKNLSFGTSNVFYTGSTRGYTMASNLTWRNKNTYAILAGGAGTLRINDTDTRNTFVALETGTRINTQAASFRPYARLGYAQYHTQAARMTNRPSTEAIDMNSLRLSGGVNTLIPVTSAMMVRVSGEVSNEFLGRTQAVARQGNYASSSLINVSGVEYAGSVNLLTNMGNGLYTQVEAGTRKNNFGTNNYATVGARIAF